MASLLTKRIAIANLCASTQSCHCIKRDKRAAETCPIASTPKSEAQRPDLAYFSTNENSFYPSSDRDFNSVFSSRHALGGKS